ncbi:hypothetical protein VP01_4898g1 [Puccinia sorghi]|uniref:Uncharacterized protein n=1 Tax=Puccinia sorghi TaxID=27349 RepID=A0A0L6UP58_9BASI|nr:hypothetical protein VP01_4898g1 [Puccinia sorghi]
MHQIYDGMIKNKRGRGLIETRREDRSLCSTVSYLATQVDSSRAEPPFTGEETSIMALLAARKPTRYEERIRLRTTDVIRGEKRRRTNVEGEIEKTGKKSRNDVRLMESWEMKKRSRERRKQGKDKTGTESNSNKEPVIAVESHVWPIWRVQGGVNLTSLAGNVANMADKTHKTSIFQFSWPICRSSASIQKGVESCKLDSSPSEGFSFKRGLLSMRGPQSVQTKTFFNLVKNLQNRQRKTSRSQHDSTFFIKIACFLFFFLFFLSFLDCWLNFFFCLSFFISVLVSLFRIVLISLFFKFLRLSGLSLRAINLHLVIQQHSLFGKTSSHSPLPR